METDINLENLLREGAEKFAAELDQDKLQKFFLYKDILKEWNEKINLTAIEEDRDIIIKHFIDSLSIMPYINKQISIINSPSPACKLIDIGTGAGFPGIPLKIANPPINVTLLDSLDKRVKFLNEVITKLGLRSIKSVHGRAEDYGMNADFREQHDLAVARAVASLPVLLEYCLPFVKVGGVFIAMKGSSIEEVNSSDKALQVLGGKIEEIYDIILPFSDIQRHIILVRKLRQTPTKYPRKAGKPLKDPLI